MSFLESEDVSLRPVEKEDLEFLRDTRMMEGVEEEMGFRYPANIEQMETGFEELSEKEGHIEFLIEYRGEKSGHITLDIDTEKGNGDIGLFIHPDFQGKEIGTTALRLVIDYAFSEFPINRIDGSYREGNEVSRKLQEKLGFKEESRERDFLYLRGEYHDLITTSILKQEWKSEDSFLEFLPEFIRKQFSAE